MRRSLLDWHANTFYLENNHESFFCKRVHVSGEHQRSPFSPVLFVPSSSSSSSFFFHSVDLLKTFSFRVSELFSLSECKRQKECAGDEESVQHEFIQLRRVKQGTWENHDFFCKASPQMLCQIVSLEQFALVRLHTGHRKSIKKKKKKTLVEIRTRLWYFPADSMLNTEFTSARTFAMLYHISPYLHQFGSQQPWCNAMVLLLFDALAFFFSFSKTIATIFFIDKTSAPVLHCFSFHFRFDSKKKSIFVWSKKKKCNTI